MGCLQLVYTFHWDEFSNTEEITALDVNTFYSLNSLVRFDSNVSKTGAED